MDEKDERMLKIPYLFYVKLTIESYVFVMTKGEQIFQSVPHTSGDLEYIIWMTFFVVVVFGA